MKTTCTLAALSLAALPCAALEIERHTARGTVLSNTGMDLKTGPGEADAFSIQLRTPLGRPLPLGDRAQLSIGLAYEGTALRFDGTEPAFPLPDAELHEISLPVIARYQRPGSPWSFTAGLTPGVASDFDHFDCDDLFLGGRIVWERTVSDTFKFGFGAAVIRSLGNDTVLPALGFEWQPAEAWLVELAGPYLNVWWQPAEPWLVRFGGGPAGGVWNVDWNNQSRDLSLSSYLVGFGVERRLNDHFWLTAGVGVSLGNRLELTHTGGLTTYKTGLEDGLFATLGLRVASW